MPETMVMYGRAMLRAVKPDACVDVELDEVVLELELEL